MNNIEWIINLRYEYLNPFNCVQTNELLLIENWMDKNK